MKHTRWPKMEKKLDLNGKRSRVHKGSNQWDDWWVKEEAQITA